MAELARVKKENMDQHMLIVDLQKKIEALNNQNSKLAILES